MENANDYLDMELDLEDLTIGDLETIEDITGLPFDEAFQPGKPKAKFLKAVAYVIRRRENPDFTLEDAGNLKVALATPEEDPTEAAG